MRRRPRRVEPLLDSIARSTPEPHRILFLADKGDNREIRTLGRVGAEYIELEGHGYAQKINFGITKTDSPLVFLGADDLEFEPGWLPAARAHILEGAGLVGVNDLIPRKRPHSTHFLLTREYAEQPTIDGKRGPLYEGYHHNYTDNELILTAKRRGVYAYAEDSRVRHLHPLTGGPDDATYRLGRSSYERDRKIFHKRRRRFLYTR